MLWVWRLDDVTRRTIERKTGGPGLSLRGPGQRRRSKEGAGARGEARGGWCLWGPCCHSPWRFFCVTACLVLPRWRAEAQAAFLPPSCLVFSDRVEAWASSWGWGMDTYSSMPRDRWCTVVFLVFFVHCSCSSWGIFFQKGYQDSEPFVLLHKQPGWGSDSSVLVPRGWAQHTPEAF